MPLPVCFAASALLPLRAESRLPRRAPVCVLGNRADPASSLPAAPKKAPQPTDKPTSRPQKAYRVLDEGLDKNQLPPPAPVHYSLPIFGFFVEPLLGLGDSASRAQRYNGIFRSNFFVRDMHIVTDADAMVEIIKNPKLFPSSGSSSVLESAFGSDSIVLLDGKEHTATKAMLAPMLSPRLFPFYIDSIRTQAARTWASLERSAASPGKTLLEPAIRNHYLSIIIKLSTGIEADSEFSNAIRGHFVKLQRAFLSPSFGPIYAQSQRAKRAILDILIKICDEYLETKADIIERLRAYGDDLTYLGCKDIAKGEVNMMLMYMAHSDVKTGPGQKNDPVAVEKLASNVFGLWFAGYATSAVTTTCAAFELGLHPDVASALRAEQDALVADAGSREVTYEQTLSCMPLLESYITEILRLHPAATGVMRRTSAPVEVLGHHVPANEGIFFDFISANYDPKRYPDPDTLRVDRFLRKPGEIPAPYVFTFGTPGSAHFCLGAALSLTMIKTTLAVHLREYEMELDPHQDKSFVMLPEILPKTKGIVKSFKRRFE